MGFATSAGAHSVSNGRTVRRGRGFRLAPLNFALLCGLVLARISSTRSTGLQRTDIDLSVR